MRSGLSGRNWRLFFRFFILRDSNCSIICNYSYSWIFFALESPFRFDILIEIKRAIQILIPLRQSNPTFSDGLLNLAWDLPLNLLAIRLDNSSFIPAAYNPLILIRESHIKHGVSHIIRTISLIWHVVKNQIQGVLHDLRGGNYHFGIFHGLKLI